MKTDFLGLAMVAFVCLALGAILGWTVREEMGADQWEMIGRAHDAAIESYRDSRQGWQPRRRK